MNRPIGTDGAIGNASAGQSTPSPALARRRLEKTSIYLSCEIEGRRAEPRANSANSANWCCDSAADADLCRGAERTSYPNPCVVGIGVEASDDAIRAKVRAPQYGKNGGSGPPAIRGVITPQDFCGYGLVVR